jgi:hypothetical protein
MMLVSCDRSTKTKMIIYKEAFAEKTAKMEDDEALAIE